MSSPQDTTLQSVRRRQVFYLPGYDPFHPRRYRELYRKEGAAQAAISEYELSVFPRSKAAQFGWQVHSEQEGAEVEVEVDVLVWHDIVRDSMATGIAATYVQLLRTAWAYIGTGAIFRLMQLRKGPMIAALYPILFLLGQLVFAVVVGWGFFRLGTWAFGEYMMVRLVFGAAGLGVAWAVLEQFRKRDRKVFAYYLMHDYAFSAQYGGANPPPLEARMSELGDVIAGSLTRDLDEVLVVGHSSGAHLAVSILSDLIRGGRVPENGPVLSFLSLGHVVPMVSFLPRAGRLRADLNILSQSNALTWVDVTAPGDGCSFALCDPVSVTGVAPSKKRWPLVLSAAYSQTLSSERWKALRWRFFRLHFQYLCAFDRPRDYDYFRITAGPQTLAERFADRAPSPARIEKAVNRFTDQTR